MKIEHTCPSVQAGMTRIEQINTDLIEHMSYLNKTTTTMSQKAALVLSFFIFLFPVFSSGQTALEIVKKADELTRGKSSEGEMTIQIVRPKWTREMKMKTWSLGTDYSLMLITAPAKEKGTVMLKREKEVWNWVPSIERTVKLPPSMMMQSWMGTDLTNDDLVRQSSIVIDYTHAIVKDSVVEGRKCWKLKLTAKPDAPVVWGHIMVWVDKEHYIQLRTEFYDEDGYLVNIFNAYDIKVMDGRTMATKMEMIPVDKPGNKTILITDYINFDTGVKEDYFNTNQMKKMK
ncbi:MAG: outer membrane lipoprotein-sorting protein [Flavobacteriales bacterium]|jgi:outer membrane lipoprotein-sorting protein|nr:outer membrane lipoprotein-sorting protein [Flavobacteriales bacterium]